MVILTCKHIIDCLTQNINKLGMSCSFVICALSIQLASEFDFPYNTGIAQIVYICFLLIMCVSTKFPS